MISSENKIVRSLVHGLRGIVLKLGFCWSIAYRVGEFIPLDRALIRKSALPLKLFLSSWNKKKWVSADKRKEQDGIYR